MRGSRSSCCSCSSSAAGQVCAWPRRRRGCRDRPAGRWILGRRPTGSRRARRRERHWRLDARSRRTFSSSDVDRRRRPHGRPNRQLGLGRGRGRGLGRGRSRLVGHRSRLRRLRDRRQHRRAAMPARRGRTLYFPLSSTLDRQAAAPNALLCPTAPPARSTPFLDLAWCPSCPSCPRLSVAVGC